MTDLARFIESSPLIDSHEHLHPERKYVEEGPDLLQLLFDSYIPHDLAAAGATQDQINALLYGRSLSSRERFEPIATAWRRCQHTGYGQAVQVMARELFGMDEITPAAIDAAQAKATALRRPGERLRILRDLARLDHVQIDAFGVPAPDESGPEFFLYDLSWFDLSSGQVDASQLHQRCGVSVTDLASLRSAIEAMFARYAPLAVAVKTQHAYVRTLEWRSRGDADVEPLLARSLKGEKLGVDERLCLGDWCLERGAEQAERHDRPIKIHTGYYAGTGYLGSSFPMTGIGAARLAPLIARHPRTRFVLMHVSYPYCDELLALAKHYANVYVDLCWAWSIAPDATARFVRRAIHTVPAHKLFVFGGDTGWPGASMAYAIQARTWLARALAAEVSEGLLTEKQAMELAEDMMLNNQRACFRLSSTRSAIRAAMANAASPPAAPAPTAVATPA